MNVTATFLFNGMSDYWGGDGDRCDDNKGCLFAFYGYDTTMRDLIDQWVDDFWNGGDCDTLPKEVTSEVVREALLNMLTSQGLAEYHNDSLCEFAIECAACNGVGAYISEDGCNDDDSIRERMEDDGSSEKMIEDALGEYLDSPIAIVMIECEEEEERDAYELECQHCFWKDSEDTMDVWFWRSTSDDDEAEEYGPYFSEADAEANNPNEECDEETG